MASSLGSLGLPWTPQSGVPVKIKVRSCCCLVQALPWLPPHKVQVLAKPTLLHPIQLALQPALNSCHSPLLTLLQPRWPPHSSDIANTFPPGECPCCALCLDHVPPDVYMASPSLPSGVCSNVKSTDRPSLTTQAKIAPGLSSLGFVLLW